MEKRIAFRDLAAALLGLAVLSWHSPNHAQERLELDIQAETRPSTGPIGMPQPTSVLSSNGDSQSILSISDLPQRSVVEPNLLADFPGIGPSVEPSFHIQPVPGVLPSEADPRIALGTFLSWIDGSTWRPMLAPVPGATLRVLLRSSEQSHTAVRAEIAAGPRGNGVAKSRRIEAWLDHTLSAAAPPNTVVLAFQLPQDLEAGPRMIRFSLGTLWTRWTQFEVAAEDQTHLRAELAKRVIEALNAGGAGAQNKALIGPYRSLPRGSVVSNGLTGGVTHRIDSAGQWLFYSFDPRLGGEQPQGNWALIDGNNGRILATETMEGWPVVHGPNNTGILFDAGPPPVRNQQAFLANELDHTAEFGLHEPPPEVAPTRGDPFETFRLGEYGFWGSYVAGPCPVIRKIAVIVQLDDQQEWTVKDADGNESTVQVDAFGEKAERLKTTFQNMGFAVIYHLTPGQMISGRVPWFRDGADAPKGINLDALDHLLRSVAAQADCCTEVVVTTLSHGLTNLTGALKDKRSWPANMHFLKYAHRNADGDVVALDVVSSKDMVALTLEPFYAARKQCVPLSIIFNACYSGKGVAEAARFLRKPHYDIGKPNVQLIGSSSSCQTTRALNWSDGTSDYPFIDALAHCVTPRNKGFADKNTWPCILKWIKDRVKAFCDATGGDCFEQTPVREVFGGAAAAGR